MRIPLNLASEPFRRDRPVVVAATILCVILCCTCVLLLYHGVMARRESLQANRDVEAARRQLEAVNREHARLEAILQRPENREVIERSVFLNELLRRKGISWTRIFADLEKVLPYNVRLISVRPQVTPENTILLDMMVGSQASEPVVEMMVRMENSSEFGSVVTNNFLPPSQTEPLFRYRISVNYAQKL